MYNSDEVYAYLSKNIFDSTASVMIDLDNDTHL
jgi:hypothetical protein